MSNGFLRFDSPSLLMYQLWIFSLLIILQESSGNTKDSDLSQVRICQLRCVAKCVTDEKVSYSDNWVTDFEYFIHSSG